MGRARAAELLHRVPPPLSAGYRWNGQLRLTWGLFVSPSPTPANEVIKPGNLVRVNCLHSPKIRVTMLAMNSLAPEHMSSSDRLAELAEILATGIVRLRHRSARQSSQFAPDAGESPLDYSGERSGHAARNSKGTRR